MNILISGAKGFIGAYLKSHLSCEHKVFTISRSEKMGKLTSLDYQIDLSDVNAVRDNFTEEYFSHKIDVIVHCAAVFTGPDNKDISLFHRNISITESMIHIAEVTRADKFINISTIGVYPNVSGNYTEESAIHPSMNHECLYGLSKFCSEELFEFYLKDICQVVNLRLGQVYGQGMRDDRIFSIMREELQSENSITVFGKGERISNFVSIEYCIIKICEIIQKVNVRGTYNLGETNLSYYELASNIIKEFGNADSKIVFIEKGVRSKVFIDSTKINFL